MILIDRGPQREPRFVVTKKLDRRAAIYRRRGGMILIDYEGEILLDITEIAVEHIRPTLGPELAKRGWSEDQVETGLVRAFSVPTNGYPEGRSAPCIGAFEPVAWWRFWHRWWFR